MPSSRALKLHRMPEYGQIWLADLSPSHGTEPGKLRPVLIVQTAALLEAGHPSTLVIPLTTRLIDDAEPLRVRIAAGDRLRETSDLLIDQLRAIDNRRFTEGPLMTCSPELLDKVRSALRIVLDIG